jgi:iron complex transport system substrate-binding protein
LRIVCLSAETAELCARIGAWDDVVAISAYADQSGLPAKPIASGFSSGAAGFILKFEPDLVLGYSDVQADLAAELIRAGATVLITNQRTLAETVSAMRLIGGAVGRAAEVEAAAREFEAALGELRRSPGTGPRVYFEEWPEPVITGIAWVGELIELLGGVDVFADRRGRAARERVTSDAEVLARAPQLILASWCGRPVDLPALQTRFGQSPAGLAGHIYEVPSAEVLQPGFGLIRGARRLAAIFDKAKHLSRCV